MRTPKLFAFSKEVLKNLMSPPATLDYPKETAHYPKRMRGHIRIDITQCISCTLCARSCPSQALSVDREAGTWVIDRFACIQCGNCVHVCPKHCLFMEQGYPAPAVEKKSERFVRPKAEQRLPQASAACVFCTLCAQKCPKQAIRVDREKRCWQLDEKACVGCGLCVKSCPKQCIEMKTKEC